MLQLQINVSLELIIWSWSAIRSPLSSLTTFKLSNNDFGHLNFLFDPKSLVGTITNPSSFPSKYNLGRDYVRYFLYIASPVTRMEGVQFSVVWRVQASASVSAAVSHQSPVLSRDSCGTTSELTGALFILTTQSQYLIFLIQTLHKVCLSKTYR